MGRAGEEAALAAYRRGRALDRIAQVVAILGSEEAR